MRNILFIVFIFLLPVTVMSQATSVTKTGITTKSETVITMAERADIKIFPVPVRQNNFTVSASGDFSQVKITNIIGQEILRNKYPTPVPEAEILLENPRRGLYLVTVVFPDNSRVVRKIMIEL